MRKTILAFGLSSGGIASAFMLATTPFVEEKMLGTADLIGYSSIVLVGLLIFLGVRSYRRKSGGRLTFRQGFLVGLGITLVSSAVYLLAFQILYYGLRPGIHEVYAECMIERAERGGATSAEIAETTERARKIVELYENPWTNIAITLLESLPAGLVLAILAAAVLRKR